MQWRFREPTRRLVAVVALCAGLVAATPATVHANTNAGGGAVEGLMTYDDGNGPVLSGTPSCGVATFGMLLTSVQLNVELNGNTFSGLTAIQGIGGYSSCASATSEQGTIDEVDIGSLGLTGSSLECIYMFGTYSVTDRALVISVSGDCTIDNAAIGNVTITIVGTGVPDQLFLVGSQVQERERTVVGAIAFSG